MVPWQSWDQIIPAPRALFSTAWSCRLCGTCRQSSQPPNKGRGVFLFLLPPACFRPVGGVRSEDQTQVHVQYEHWHQKLKFVLFAYNLRRSLKAFVHGCCTDQKTAAYPLRRPPYRSVLQLSRETWRFWKPPWRSWPGNHSFLHCMEKSKDISLGRHGAGSASPSPETDC